MQDGLFPVKMGSCIHKDIENSTFFHNCSPHQTTGRSSLALVQYSCHLWAASYFLRSIKFNWATTAARGPSECSPPPTQRVHMHENLLHYAMQRFCLLLLCFRVSINIADGAENTLECMWPLCSQIWALSSIIIMWNSDTKMMWSLGSRQSVQFWISWSITWPPRIHSL